MDKRPLGRLLEPSDFRLQEVSIVGEQRPQLHQQRRLATWIFYDGDLWISDQGSRIRGYFECDLA